MAKDSGLNVNLVRLGQCISRIWKAKVNKCTRDFRTCYKNLALRSCNGEPITRLTDLTLRKITAVCLKHDGWFVASRSFSDQLILLMKEKECIMRVDGRPVVFQISVRLSPKADIIFSTYSQEISIMQILGINETLVSESAIDVAICFVETATPCFGQPIPTTSNEYFKVPVSNSKMISLSTFQRETSDQNESRRLVSLSCSLFSYSCLNPITRVISCHQCSNTRRLFMKREYKREKQSISNNEAPVHPKCNQNHLSRKGMELKMNEQKNRMKRELKRLKEDDCIEFVEEDHDDLVKIFKTTNTKAMPAEMKLLWDNQMKQLSAKSPSGYRWDPRY